jgi:hypothetical protein
MGIESPISIQNPEEKYIEAKSISLDGTNYCKVGKNYLSNNLVGGQYQEVEVLGFLNPKNIQNSEEIIVSFRDAKGSNHMASLKDFVVIFNISEKPTLPEDNEIKNTI